MKWFSAKIVFQIVVGEKGLSEFDEQYILIQADNLTTAFQKASCNGINKQDSFKNTLGEEVQWRFVNVAEMNELKELADGCELHSQIRKYDNSELYINAVHGKAEQISNFNNLDWIQLL